MGSHTDGSEPPAAASPRSEVSSWVWVFFILNIIAAIYSKTSRTNILDFYASDAGIRNITKCFDLWSVEQKMHPPLSDTSILSCEKPLYCYLM